MVVQARTLEAQTNLMECTLVPVFLQELLLSLWLVITTFLGMFEILF